MSILVTGGAGFIGSHIVDSLLEQGQQVLVVDNLSSGRRENLNPKAEFYQLDITSSELEDIFRQEKIAAIIHQAAQIDVESSFQDPISDAKNNIQGSLRLLELARKYEVKKILYASSAAVYGDPEETELPLQEESPIEPLAPYGASKHAVEHYLKIYHQQYGLSYAVLRYANVYGPRQDARGEGGVVAIFASQLQAGERPVIHGDGSQTRDFIYVGDVARANRKALTQAEEGIYNISSGAEVSINKLWQTMKELAEREIEPKRGPARPGDISRSVLANSRARKELDWQPEVELAEGLAATLKYYQP